MATVKLNLQKKTDSEILTFAQQHNAAMDGNTNFTTPVPTNTVFEAAMEEYETSLTEANLAQQSAKQKTADKDAKRLELEGHLTQRGRYVELTSNGSSSVIQTAGLDVKSALTPSGKLDQVMNLIVRADGNEGELIVEWDAVAKAKSYQLQMSADPITPTSWRDIGPSSSSRKKLKNLTSGTRVWVRVCAIAPKEENNGDWSDPAVKMVP